MYIDSSAEASGRFALNAANADSADKLNTSAGSSTKPVYFLNGKPVALSSTIGANNKPVFLSSGSITASNATIGANNKPVYMNGGVITASTQTIGSAALPVYMNGGTITACAAGSIFSGLSWTNGTTAGPVISITVAGQGRTSTIPSASNEVSGVVTTGEQVIAGAKTFSGAMTVNSTIKAAGTITAPAFSGALSGNATTATTATKLGSTTIGGTAKPIYLKDGVATACSSNVGSASLPVYMSGGTITACTAGSVFSNLSWGGGTSAGPYVSITVAGQNRTSTIPSASSSASGVVTTGAQTFAGAKTFSGVLTASSSVTISGALTASGRTTANGQISVPSVGGNWISGMTLTNASVAITTTNSKGSYHPLLAVKTYNSHVANIGAYVDQIGFYGFKNDRTENGVDHSFTFNVSSGAVTSTGTVTAPTFSGTLNGNAATASKWQTTRTLKWTGDATGSMSVNGSADASASLTLVSSGVTAGSYGPSANASPGVSGTFSVPYFTVDSKGRITAASTKTITMPTDTKVTNTKNNTTKAYITGTTSSSTNTGEQIFDTGVYLSTTAGNLVATTFTGALNGNATTATTATKLGSSTVGGAAKPIYLNAGVATACSSTVGSASLPVYMSSGTITSCTASSLFSSLYWSGGTSYGPVVSMTVAGQNRTATIPSASASASGAVTTGSQTFAGSKTFNAQALFGGGLKIGSSSDGATITYDGSTDTLTITFP